MQVTLLLQFLATPAGAAAVNATLAIPEADRAAIIALPGLVDATQARRTGRPFLSHSVYWSSGGHAGAQHPAPLPFTPLSTGRVEATQARRTRHPS